MQAISMLFSPSSVDLILPHLHFSYVSTYSVSHYHGNYLYLAFANLGPETRILQYFLDLQSNEGFFGRFQIFNFCQNELLIHGLLFQSLIFFVC